MIVVDIETSGLYPEKHGIWQIGALDFYNSQNVFLEEARIDFDGTCAVPPVSVTEIDVWVITVPVLSMTWNMACA